LGGHRPPVRPDRRLGHRDHPLHRCTERPGRRRQLGAADRGGRTRRPAAGRVCQTGVRLVPQVTETLIGYDDANRTLTYEASGMPTFVTLARNTWTVTAIDAHRSRVSLRARFDTRGLLGRLGRWAILAQTRRASRHLTEDLRHYVQTGQPTPRKQRQQRRAAARIPTR